MRGAAPGRVEGPRAELGMQPGLMSVYLVQRKAVCKKLWEGVGGGKVERARASLETEALSQMDLSF